MIHDGRDVLLNLKGELQRENKLISYERAFKMLENDMYITGTGRAILKLSTFKVELGNHQSENLLISEIVGNLQNYEAHFTDLTSHLTIHNFQILKLEIFFKPCKI